MKAPNVDDSRRSGQARSAGRAAKPCPSQNLDQNASRGRLSSPLIPAIPGKIFLLFAPWTKSSALLRGFSIPPNAKAILD